MAKYQGWTNYETWAVSLWLSNDEGSCRFCEELAEECYEEAETDKYSSRKENAARELADKIKQMHEDALEERNAGRSDVFCDLLNAAMSEVNWHEIAKGMIDEAKEEAA